MAAEKTKTRYVLREKIGAGDYAKVYSAEDTKLGRKVAIKQLHSQFLDDKEKLKRYWRESRLMLDLDHPNIMSIYDVIRSRGCLVLELMRGSLNEIYSNKPMPVDDVRETIIEAAKGLECMHKNGIVHGDVKPANLMLSRQDVVKLGDFGLARRVSDDEGSLLKGTTKYMAPELVSEDFGEVGAASDLYSLGFSALELMIGPEFDSLFPDLIAFGRDKQMAWMMWHCSADRKFPPIETMLDGVPEDLAKALNRLTNKDQAKRYATAREVIFDLSGGVKPVGQSLKEAEEAKRLKEEKAKKKRRKRAIMACVASAMVCTAMIAYSIFGKSDPKPLAAAPAPVRGVIQNVLPVDEKFVVDIGSDWREFTLRAGDEVTLNRKKRQLRDLQLGDRVTVSGIRQPDGGLRKEIMAFRPGTHTGVISKVNLTPGEGDEPPTASLVFSVTKGEESGRDFELNVSAETMVSVNEKAAEKGASGVGLLLPEDRAVVHLSDDESGMVAIKIDALRVVGLEGFIRKLDPKRGKITIAVSLEGDSDLVALPITADTKYSLNGLDAIDGKLVAPADLEIDDRVSIKYDVNIVSADAFRIYEDRGRIVDVNFETNNVVVKSTSATSLHHYQVGDTTNVTLGDEKAKLADLRIGDTLKVVHESPDEEAPLLVSLAAARPNNRKRWAILVANEEFNSPGVGQLSTPIKDLESIKSCLINRFGVPKSQVFVFQNEDKVRLQEEIPNHLKRASANSEFYIYVATKGFTDKRPNDKIASAYLAAKDSVVGEMDSTGLGLEWLIDAIDDAPCNRKMLMLDCWNDEGQPSAWEMVELVKKKKRGGYPRSSYVLANCIESQKASFNKPGDAKDRGLFGYQVAQAFSGEADLEKDFKVEITELADYVIDQVSTQSKKADAAQTPFLFVPDSRPPRLSEASKREIITLLSQFGKDMTKKEIIASSHKIAQGASSQPEPMLACGLLLIKKGKTREAFEILENVRLNHPKHMLVKQSVIWIHYNRRHYKQGCELLRDLLESVPLPEEGAQYDSNTLVKFEWAGRLRELGEASAAWAKSSRVPTPDSLAGCDEAVKKHGTIPMQRYEKGRQEVKKIVEGFAERLKNDSSSSAILERERLRSYVPSIASNESIAEIRAGLDRD